MTRLFYICNPDDLEVTEDQKVRIKANRKKNLPGLKLSISITDDLNDKFDKGFYKKMLIRNIKGGSFKNILLEITNLIITDFFVD